ncbi:hypothetical protein L596_027183 [Steinernema carpocapsae]|uniref:Uncharacterized protein n=1 Tax=Steinernema carpocapsae TaxID=34508 RepID=A0A4U5M4N1_STECR|nr:hypothetical protein L596_027183 [Steinernema carpocapsae]
MRSLFFALFFLVVFVFLQTHAAPYFPADDLPDLASLRIREWASARRFKRELYDLTHVAAFPVEPLIWEV